MHWEKKGPPHESLLLGDSGGSERRRPPTPPGRLRWPPPPPASVRAAAAARALVEVGFGPHALSSLSRYLLHPAARTSPTSPPPAAGAGPGFLLAGSGPSMAGSAAGRGAVAAPSPGRGPLAAPPPLPRVVGPWPRRVAAASGGRPVVVPRRRRLGWSACGRAARRPSGGRSACGRSAAAGARGRPWSRCCRRGPRRGALPRRHRPPGAREAGGLCPRRRPTGGFGPGLRRPCGAWMPTRHGLEVLAPGENHVRAADRRRWR